MVALILAIYSSYSYGFKNVRNVIEMALKSLFLPQNHKNNLSTGVSASICDALGLHQFVPHGGVN